MLVKQLLSQGGCALMKAAVRENARGCKYRCLMAQQHSPKQIHSSTARNKWIDNLARFS